MTEEQLLPKIRPVDAIPVEVEGRQLVCITDQLRLVESQVLVSPPMMVVLMHLDGTHALRDVQAEFLRKYGLVLPGEKIEELVRVLDEALLLDTDNFRAFYKEIEDAFRTSDVRSPTHAGQSYEADPEKLRTWITGLFPDGIPQPDASTPRTTGMIVPHYDLRAAGPLFAAAYAEAARGPRPEAVVILGTGHMSQGGSLFTATEKSYQTPLGVQRTDRDAVRALGEALGESLFEEEMLHRSEHSVEFQVLFVQAAFGDVPVVPVLVHNFHPFLTLEEDPGEDERVVGFLEALRGFYGDRPVLTIASVDLAHVGPRFGDSWRADDSPMSAVEEFDREILDCALRADGGDFYRAIARTGDRTRICGFPAIRVLLELVGEGKGRLLEYTKSIDPTGSAVTYASMVFEAP
jgi:AmmeMemoRadiSam system protein B